MRALGGHALEVSSPQGRFAAEQLMAGAARVRLERVEACGKHLFYVFEAERTVHVHLGLFGKFFQRRQPAPAPRPTTRMRLASETRVIDLVGPTACELLAPADVQRLLARLGPDPLRSDADPERFVALAARSRVAIGALLLDQSAIAGVGNVYRAEALHMPRIHPSTPARSLPRARLLALWELLAALLQRGVTDKRIITTQGLAPGPARRVARAERLHVYGRRQCASCAGPVTRELLRARAIYLCERCQPQASAARVSEPAQPRSA